MNMFQKEDLSKLSIFQCKSCLHRLHYPIMEVANFGNICGTCYERSVFTNVVQNSKLEESLSQLNVPCKYRYRGCYFEGPFVKTCNHEKQCHLRNRICPFAYENECEFDLISDIIDHIRRKHSERVLKAEDHSVMITNPILSKHDIFYLLFLTHRYFLIRVKLDIKNMLLLYLFYYFNDNDDPYHFTVFVKHGNFSLLSTNIDALHESDLTSAFDYTYALKLNLSLLENLKCAKKIAFIINFEQSKEEQLKCFECPICFNYMLNAIHLCKEGHSFCYSCFKRLLKCPICKTLFSGRNFSLESISQKYKFPCKNTGCNKYTVGADYDLHDMNCLFRTYTCPFEKTSDKCIWKGFYNTLPEHLKKVHEGFVHESGDTLCIAIDPGTKYYCCFIKENSVIICSYELVASKRLHFSAGLLNPNYYRNLVYVLHLERQNSVNKFILVESCEEYKSCHRNNIDVSEYMLKDYLKLTLYIKCQNEE